MNTNEDTITYSELGSAGIGTIEAGPHQQERLEECTQRLAEGEFHVAIPWDATYKKMTLVRCVDGRIPASGANPLGPNAAGGTESLFVADDLTTKRFTGDDATTIGGYSNLLSFLTKAGFEVGGHTDEHAEDITSGCGANDKLEKIYTYIAQHHAALRTVASRFGVQVSNDDHALITKNAASRHSFSPGRELFTSLQSYANEAFVDVLAGSHNEVVALLNTVSGTTLDRDALRREFGDAYEAFNVDIWAFEDAARVISQTEEEVSQKVSALVYYNLATAMVLSGKKMRIIALAT